MRVVVFAFLDRTHFLRVTRRFDPRLWSCLPFIIGGACSVGKPYVEGCYQRGYEGLGDQRRGHPLPYRIGDRPAPFPNHCPGLPGGHRQGIPRSGKETCVRNTLRARKIRRLRTQLPKLTKEKWTYV